MKGWRVDTLASHLAREGAPGPVVEPIAVSSTYALRDAAEGARLVQSTAPTEFYARWGTPSNRDVERAVAALEGGPRGLTTASGMGAIATVLLGAVKQGSRIVAGKGLYTATAEMMLHYLPRFGVETTLVDPTVKGAFREAVGEDTSLVYVETPANPTLFLTDLAEASEAARDVGAVVAADNTFATPVNQRPLAWGADVVVHSATKYLGGHADVTGGVIVTKEEDLFEELWETYKMLGPTLGAVDAFLIARGIRTLPLRVRRHNEGARAVAEFLEDDRRVARVHYPGLDFFPQRELARRQMEGFGGMLSLELEGGYEAAVRFVEGVRVARLAVSLGGVETLVEHAASMTHGTLTREERQAAGIPEGLVRVSVGLEDPEDLKEDFHRALASPDRRQR